MELRILVDTNILLDYLLDREPHEKSARTIIKACQQKKMEGCVAAHSITNIFKSSDIPCVDADEMCRIIESHQL
ncbi:PIN domain-containing protein [Schaedlerella sp.]|uniref:PIN domain-containing protein n=1 Tax=Schaedlerella sp. TaxID=2676057 RepID=UPI003748661C